MILDDILDAPKLLISMLAEEDPFCRSTCTSIRCESRDWPTKLPCLRTLDPPGRRSAAQYVRSGSSESRIGWSLASHSAGNTPFSRAHSPFRRRLDGLGRQLRL